MTSHYNCLLLVAIRDKKKQDVLHSLEIPGQMTLHDNFMRGVRIEKDEYEERWREDLGLRRVHHGFVGFALLRDTLCVREGDKRKEG